MVDWTALILFPLIVLSFGLLGGIITRKKIDTWHKYLVKPRLNPPNWIFGPVWTTLYLMIGFSGYLAYEEDDSGFSSNKFGGWFCYFTQLVLNFLWTPLFFGLNWMFISFIDIILLDFFIILNIMFFWDITVIGACLLIPYCLWVSFASYLNLSFWYNNQKKNN